LTTDLQILLYWCSGVEVLKQTGSIINGMTTLDDNVAQFENTLAKMTRAFDVFINQYLAIVQKQQFDVNTLTSIEDMSDVQNAVIDLSKRVAQQTVFNSILINLPSGVTTATIQLARYKLTLQNPASIIVLYPVQYLIGSGDAVKLTWTPLGTSPAYFALYGYKTGGNQQL
jgi:hypothetical protein